MEGVLKTVQGVLHNVNPFVKDFKQIMEIPAEELENGKIIISANGVNLNGGVLIPQEMITEIVPNKQTEPKNYGA